MKTYDGLLLATWNLDVFLLLTFEIDLDVVGVVERHDALVRRLVFLVELQARREHEHGRGNRTAASAAATSRSFSGARAAGF